MPNSTVCMVGGCLMLFTSWLLFNAGSNQSIVQNKATNIPERTVINTILSASAATACVIFIDLFARTKIDLEQNVTFKIDLVTIIDAILAGCVSITGSCDNVSQHNALIIGFIGGLVYKLSVGLLQKLEIDDPLNVSEVHGFCGLWGLMAVGFFDNDHGLIYFGSFDLLQKQLIGAGAIIAWTAVLSAGFFTIMNRTGRFRIGQAFEIYGLDNIEDAQIKGK